MSDPNGTADVDCVVVGAGFSGIYATHRLRESGKSVRCFDAGSDIGGVWNWNRYPGATVDVLSRDYSYSFSDDLQQDWQWSMRFSRQPEIIRYQKHVAERFGLTPHIQLQTRVTATIDDERACLWRVETDQGDTLSARFVVMACGHLSALNKPDFPGLDQFAGEVHHTGGWPREEVRLAGKRVAVVGTGSSGIQAITAIAPQVEQLYVLQRTPHFSLPINVAAKLKPNGYPIGTKRICLDEGYYETFNRENVQLVSLQEAPITRFTENGVVIAGEEIALDMVIFATGYDAFTGSLFKIDIRGKADTTLPEKWADGPSTYLGLATAGSPHFFILQGPGSRSVFVNLVTGGSSRSTGSPIASIIWTSMVWTRLKQRPRPRRTGARIAPGWSGAACSRKRNRGGAAPISPASCGFSMPAWVASRITRRGAPPPAATITTAFRSPLAPCRMPADPQQYLADAALGDPRRFATTGDRPGSRA